MNKYNDSDIKAIQNYNNRSNSLNNADLNPRYKQVKLKQKQDEML